MKDNETFYNQRSSNLLNNEDGIQSENDKNLRNSKLLRSLNEVESLHFKKNA